MHKREQNQIDEQTLNELVAQFNELIITYRQQHLEQGKDSYLTCKFPLSDKRLKQHLTGTKTIGIRLGNTGLTKFMTFDVDFKDNPKKAEEVTCKLVNALQNHYGIDSKEIHVDYSGSKGFHVSLFFNKVVLSDDLIPFYKEVVAYIGESERQVEFRASKSHGIKLPLGWHKATNNFMAFCRYEHDEYNPRIKKLSRKQSYEYFLGIKAMEWADFAELVLHEVGDKPFITSLEKEQGEQFEDVVSSINLEGKEIAELEQELIAVVNNQRLTYESTRNRITFLLSIFFKEQGFELDETIQEINQIMLNTYDNYRELIDRDTKREFVIKEVERISKNTFEKDYSFTTKRRDLTIYESEILTILNVKEWHLKKLLFTLLVASKRYAKPNGIFYMAYSVMTRMGNNKNRSHLLGHLVELESRELIKIVSRNEIDLIQTRLQGAVMKKANVYQCLFVSDEHEQDKGILIESNKEITLEEVTALLVEKQEAKKVLPKKQFYNYFLKEYKGKAI